MEEFRVISPTFLQIPTDLVEDKDLRSFLSCIDKKIDFDIKRLKDSLRYRVFSDTAKQALLAEIDFLKGKRLQNLLFQNSTTDYYTYSGFGPELSKRYGRDLSVDYSLPEPELLPYVNRPKFESRYYQIAAHDALLGASHRGPCRVEMGTGLGKSSVIRMLVKSLGLQTLIQAPSTSIALQLYDDFVYHFGKKYVGLYGGGKKELGKLITIGIDDSLTLIEPGSEAGVYFALTQTYVADESHLLAASSLKKVALELVPNAPYRFFFSATQIRNDGLDLILDGLTGPTVYTMTTKEGVDQGFLAKPSFRVFSVESPSKTRAKDPNKETRLHLYYNPNVVNLAAETAAYFATQQQPVLILVEEIEQFVHLQKALSRFGVDESAIGFAHAPLTKENKKLLPERYHTSDSKTLVKDFNAGKTAILVGTSAIATGTDITCAEVLIYLMGKTSEIKVRQAIGRGTRGGRNSCVFNPWTGIQKTAVLVFDFDVINIDSTHRHALSRQEYFLDSYPDMEIIQK